MIKQSKWVRAHTNIAFIKYWGKEDETLILDKNNSLSLTLDAFYTDTQVCFDKKLNKDILFIDGKEQDKKALKKAQVILDLVRKEAGIHEFARKIGRASCREAGGIEEDSDGGRTKKRHKTKRT